MKWIFGAIAALFLIWEIGFYIEHGEPTPFARMYIMMLALYLMVQMMYGVNRLAISTNRHLSRWINRLFFRGRRRAYPVIVAPTEKLNLSGSDGREK